MPLKGVVVVFPDSEVPLNSRPFKTKDINV